MQIANCFVRLSGDINNEVFKGGVTPPEVVMLRAIHGTDAVIKIQPKHQDRRPHAEEIDRLKREYGDRRFAEVFPGSYVNLPVNFSDIGVTFELDDKPKRSRKATDATAEEAVGEE